MNNIIHYFLRIEKSEKQFVDGQFSRIYCREQISFLSVYVPNLLLQVYIQLCAPTGSLIDYDYTVAQLLKPINVRAVKAMSQKSEICLFNVHLSLMLI